MNDYINTPLNPLTRGEVKHTPLNHLSRGELKNHSFLKKLGVLNCYIQIKSLNLIATCFCSWLNNLINLIDFSRKSEFYADKSQIDLVLKLDTLLEGRCNYNF
jgi:hypothetical protein